MKRDEYGIIILAAGNSSRLGAPKQLLQYQGKSLIRHITEAAQKTAGDRVVVVTGANSVLIEHELAGMPVKLAFNPDWQEGMSASIKTGVHALQLHFPEAKGAILAVSDQPFVSSGLFDALILMSEETGKGIVASRYSDAPGTPALFAASYFSSLLQLSGAEGAKKLFKRFSNDVSAYPFPEGSIDIDTQEDYKRLISSL